MTALFQIVLVVELLIGARHATEERPSAVRVFVEQLGSVPYLGGGLFFSVVPKVGVSAPDFKKEVRLHWISKATTAHCPDIDCHAGANDIPFVPSVLAIAAFPFPTVT
jgi:hypothetical protein